MTRSMTGFGRAQSESAELSISVEMKSVNHRYFELSTRCPRQYSFLEEKIKSYLQTRIARGKVECSVSILELDAADVEVQVNHGLAKAYLAALKEITETYDVRNDVSAMSLTRFNDVLSEGQEVQVKITDVDAENKRISLSIRALLEQPAEDAE